MRVQGPIGSAARRRVAEVVNAAGPFFLLAAPASLLAFSLLLLAARAALKRQARGSDLQGLEFMTWIALGIQFFACGLALHSLMDNELLARTAVFVALFYLAGAGALHYGVVLRFRLPARHGLLALLCSASLLGVFCFAEWHDDLASRIAFLCSGLAAVSMLALPALTSARMQMSLPERLFALSYAIGAGLMLVRVGWALGLARGSDLSHFTLSGEWQIFLICMMVYFLWFSALTAVVALSDLVGRLRLECLTDPLSGLFNRRGFFAESLRRLEAHPTVQWYLIAADLDHFKSVNDRHGHHIGDQVIARFAALARERLLPGQVAGRIGGEEFLLLLDARSLDQAVARADALRVAFAREAFVGNLRVTASFGVEQVDGIEALALALRRVDLLLYEAKGTGRNKVVAARAALPSAPRPTRSGAAVGAPEPALVRVA